MDRELEGIVIKPLPNDLEGLSYKVIHPFIERVYPDMKGGYRIIKREDLASIVARLSRMILTAKRRAKKWQ